MPLNKESENTPDNRVEPEIIIDNLGRHEFEQFNHENIGPGTEPFAPTETAPRDAEKTFVPGQFAVMLVMLWGLALFVLLYSWFSGTLEGQLLPSLVIALTPGSIMVILGKNPWTFYRIGVAVGLILFLIWDGSFDFSALANLTSSPFLTLIGLASLSIPPLIGALRWRWLLRIGDVDITYWQALRLTLAGLFFNQCIPGSIGGDVLRMMWITQTSSRRLATIVGIADRLLGLPSILLIVYIVCQMNMDFIRANQTLATLYGFFSFLLFAVIILGVIGLTFFVPFLRMLLAVNSVSLDLLLQQKRILLYCILISTVGHLGIMLSGTCFALALGFFSTESGLLNYNLNALIIILGNAVNTIPIAPGGIGQGEAAYHFLYGLVDAGLQSKGPIVMLCMRIGSFIPALVGAYFYAGGKTRLKTAHDPVVTGVTEAVTDQGEKVIVDIVET